MADYTITTAGASLAVDTAVLSYTVCVPIDSTHCFGVWASTSAGLAEVLNVNPSTFEITTAGSRKTFAVANPSYYNSCKKIDDNHFLNFSYYSSSQDGIAQVFEVNTSTWEVSTNATLLFDTARGQFNSCCQIDTNHFINFYLGYDGASFGGYTEVFEVNTTTWAVTTKAARLEMDLTQANWNSCAKLDDNHFIDFWAGVGDDGFVQVFEVNTSTWEVTTANSELEFNATQGINNNCYTIDSSHVINFWAGGGADGFVQVFEVNTSTWAVTTAGSALEYDTANGIYSSCTKIDDNHFINFWTGSGADGFVQVFEVDTSTWEVTTKSIPLEFDTTNGEYNSCFEISTGVFINMWVGATDDVYIQAFGANLSPSFTPFWITVD